MSSVGRIGRAGGVERDVPSAGHELVGRARDAEAQPKRDPRIEEVAKLYEKQFLREMVKAMRGTVQFSDVSKPSMAENIYRDQLDNEYVESWGDKGGIGLSELIYEQLMERYFDGGAKAPKKHGPAALSDRDILRVSRMRSDGAGSAKQVPLRVDLKPSEAGSPTQVQAPWDGTLLSNNKIGEKTAVTLLHDGGVKSTLIFDGVPASGLQPGQSIEKGRTVGVLSPEINSFFWNLNRNASGLDGGPGRSE